VCPDVTIHWGCAPGTYNASTGDPTMIFTAAAPEIEQGKASSLHLQATTPGYNTQATVVGPYIGTVNFASTTDYLDKTVAFTPTNLGNAGFTATVTSSKGDSKTQLVGTLVVTAEELNAAGDTDTSFVEQGMNAHYKILIDGSAFRTGQSVTVALKSIDNVDIDLYFNIDELALASDNLGFDADENGNETLKLEKIDAGWQVVAGSGTVFPIAPAAEDFYFYADVAGYTASDYSVTVTRN